MIFGILISKGFTNSTMRFPGWSTVFFIGPWSIILGAKE